MVSLNDEQRAAVEETDQPVLVLAGPGTGKTAMMVEKFRHLVIAKGLRPERVLITTFTRKATEELEERISKALAADGHLSKVDVQNFHALCLDLLQEHQVRSGIGPDVPTLDNLQLRRFLYEHRKRFEWQAVPFIRRVDYDLQQLTLFMGTCISEGIGPADAIAAAKRFEAECDDKSQRKAEEYLDYARNYAVAMDLLAEKGILTFDLMLYRAVELLDQNPDIRAEVQDRYDYLLIDEVQDNNGLQARLVDLIAGDRTCVTVVGDEDQGIYKFRGAKRGILEEFGHRYSPRRIDLHQNYRSSHHIVEAAKALIDQNTERFEGKRLDAVGPNKDAPHRVQIVGYRNDEQEMLHVARTVKAHIDGGRRPGDIAILFRSLNHKDRLLDEFEALGIPYEITNLGQLLRIREVRDLWAWMQVVQDPYTDNPSVERVLASQEMGLSILELSKLQRRYLRHLQDAAKERGESVDKVRMNLVDMLRELDGPWVDDEARHRLRWARRTLEILSEKLRGLNALDSAYAMLGWLKPHRRFPPDDPRGVQAWMNLGDFFQVIKSYEQTYTQSRSLKAFLEYLDYMDRQGAQFEERAPDDTEDSVKILTAHRAKGLQYPVVIVPACNKDRFPLGYRGDWLQPLLRPGADPRAEHVEEERRVFYVAMTRAEQELMLTYSVMLGDKERARSTFLDEILDHAPAHAEARMETLDLAPTTDAQQAEEEAQYEAIHAALTVAPGATAEMLRAKAETLLHAAARAWARQADAGDVAAAIAPFSAPSAPSPEEPGYAGPLRLSASALNAYATCPRKFQFQYVMRIPQRIRGSAVAGSNVHRALEVFHDRHQDDWRTQDVQTLLDIYEEVLAESRFQDPSEAELQRKRGERILRAYLDGERDIDREPRHFEVPFEVQLAGATFHGFIDRVDEHADGSVEIVDYKTGKIQKAQGTISNDFQIPLYVLGMEALGKTVAYGSLYGMQAAGDGTGDIDRVRIPRVGEGKDKSEFTDATLDAFAAKVEDVVEAIRSGRFEEEPDDKTCSYCDYRILCPAMEK